MGVEMLFFGIAKDIVGVSQMKFSFTTETVGSVGDLKVQLIKDYPALSKLSTFAIAVNGEYAQDDLVLKNNDEVAVIPPVSGG
ncbi:MoaD/ThiS family protein [Maribacter sp. MMG018]|uniref:MoaD/ThiS family protein n=1 Tax=Maribacter sp. MMG018 TaxID=2822688 RepID=UPI001FFC7C45|nr:MoaD/ThiS family protein [Maribacter sp. MMG018]